MKTLQLRYKLIMQTAYLGTVLSCFSSAWAIAPLKLDNPPALREIAFRRYLENKPDMALDFYQKAIEKSVKEYGATGSYTSELYLEASTVALSMSKFTLAENYLSKAVTINPNSVVARMRLAEVLKLRDKPQAELAQIQVAINRHGQSAEARGKLVAWLQQHNPAQASKQAFLIDRANSAPPTPSEPVKKVEPLARITPIAATLAPAITAPNTKNKKPELKKSSSNNQKNAQANKTKKAEPSHAAHRSKPVQPPNPSNFVAKSSRRNKNKMPMGLVPPPPPMLAPGIPAMAPESGLSAVQQSAPQPESKAHKNKDKKGKKESPGTKQDEKTVRQNPEPEPPKAKIAPSNTSDPEADSNFLIDWGGVKKKK